MASHSEFGSDPEDFFDPTVEFLSEDFEGVPDEAVEAIEFLIWLEDFDMELQLYRVDEGNLPQGKGVRRKRREFRNRTIKMIGRHLDKDLTGYSLEFLPAAIHRFICSKARAILGNELMLNEPNTIEGLKLPKFLQP